MSVRIQAQIGLKKEAKPFCSYWAGVVSYHRFLWVFAGLELCCCFSAMKRLQASLNCRKHSTSPMYLGCREWGGGIRKHLLEQFMLITFQQNGVGGNFYNCILMQAARTQTVPVEKRGGPVSAWLVQRIVTCCRVNDHVRAPSCGRWIWASCYPLATLNRSNICDNGHL